MKSFKTRTKIVRIIKLLGFGITLGLFFTVGSMWFLRPDVSAVEKRNLTEFPKLTWSSFWSGEYFSGYSTWYQDTYPMRETLISLNRSLQDKYGIKSEQIVGSTAVMPDEIPEVGENSGSGTDVQNASDSETGVDNEIKPDNDSKPEDEAKADSGETNDKKDEDEEDLPDGTITEKGETMGSIYVTQGAAYELYYFNQSAAETFINTVNRAYDDLGSLVNLYVMVVPTSAGVMLDQSLIDDMNGSDQAKALEYLFGSMRDGVHKINILETLQNHNAEYVYFRTDHHWTQLGSYYGYKAFCREKGIESHDINDFDTVEYDGFAGSFCQQAQILEENPDTITAYIPMGTNDMTMVDENWEEVNWRIINDVSDYAPNQKYSTFAGGDMPLAYAHNENITDGSSVVVIKDSYGNAFIPWLIDHYEYTYWIDARYTGNYITQMVNDYEIQDVILLLNIFNCTNDGLLNYLPGIFR